MIAVVTRRPTRRVWAAALLATGVLATPLAPHAHAAFGACRSDPIVVLSNGVVLDLSANIDTDQIDIKEIGYTLHGPKGVTVVRSISTDGVVQYKEKFAFKDDSKADDNNPTSAPLYTVVVKVKTLSGDHQVQATVAAGYADHVGITPGMVGLTAFQFNPSEPQGDGKVEGVKPPHDDQNAAALPATVTTALATWATTAPWSATMSSPLTPEKQEVTAAVAL